MCNILLNIEKELENYSSTDQFSLIKKYLQQRLDANLNNYAKELEQKRKYLQYADKSVILNKELIK